MKCGISRQRLDPVLTPDQFGVAQPLGLKDLDKHVTDLAFTHCFQPQLEFHGVNM